MAGNVMLLMGLPSDGGIGARYNGRSADGSPPGGRPSFGGMAVQDVALLSTRRDPGYPVSFPSQSLGMLGLPGPMWLHWLGIGVLGYLAYKKFAK